MKSALIGYTGFVGGNLLRQRDFDVRFNSRNFREMNGMSFGEVICAGVSAIKWKANREPDADRARILELQEVLATTTARRFILISTIDVYPVTRDKDERFDCHSMDNHAYGSHRLAFEDFCKDHFENCLVVRLPGLFGEGLRKNVIYDLLHDNCLEQINPASTFQYYCLDDLWADIRTAMDAGLHLVNFFTEPVATASIIQRFFPGKEVGGQAAGEAHYDLHTIHAGLRGRSGPYLYGKDEIMKKLESFINTHRGEAV